MIQIDLKESSLQEEERKKGMVINMKPVLHHYDIYPKVVLSDEKNVITIKPLGDQARFESGTEYTVNIFKVDEANPSA